MTNQKDTIEYYNRTALLYIDETVNVDFSETQEKFLSYLKLGDYILDFGCGSGRDTKYFLNRGYKVDALDGSPELCKYAKNYTGIEVSCILFQEFDAENLYDGIWACASILHLSIDDLSDVFARMVWALKSEGIIYASFKYGEDSNERNGRLFTDFTEESFRKYIAGINDLEIDTCWITDDVRPKRCNEKWLNVILRKQN